jgi:toxin ParE1/3/4
MTRYQLSPRAIQDIADIWSYIAQDNLRAADHVETEIYRACELISRSPLAGQIRSDLTSLAVRFWVIQRHPNYLIAYDPRNEPVRILAVIHGARNLPDLLRSFF